MKVAKKGVSTVCALKTYALVPFLFAFLFLPFCVNATPIDIDIHNTTTISSGEYGTVNIYDTPPNQTIVAMTGGDISYGNVYNTAILNCYGGELFFPRIYDNAIVTIYNIDYIASVELHGNGQLHIYDGGSASSVSIQIFDNAELHVYGYGFVYNPSVTGTNAISGFWGNGERFTLGLRQPSNYDPYTQVILHEIPEPTTFLLMSVVALYLRKTR